MATGPGGARGFSSLPALPRTPSPLFGLCARIPMPPCPHDTLACTVVLSLAETTARVTITMGFTVAEASGLV